MEVFSFFRFQSDRVTVKQSLATPSYRLMNVLLRFRLCLKDTLRFLLAALAFALRLLRKLALRAQTCARLRC